MKEGIANIQADLLKDAIRKTQLQISETFKNVRPYRKPVPDPKQQLLEYELLPLEEKQFAMQNFPVEFARYEEEMAKIRSRYV